MQRHGHLWPALISFENLLRAAQQAQKGKRFRPAVMQFNLELEHELWRLHDELRTHIWQPGPYRTFYIHELKNRLISAAHYRDRVVHHALVNLLEPIYESGRGLWNAVGCRAVPRRAG
jgi:retron-type reverse transcriptase